MDNGLFVEVEVLLPLKEVINCNPSVSMIDVQIPECAAAVLVIYQRSIISVASIGQRFPPPSCLLRYDDEVLSQLSDQVNV